MSINNINRFLSNLNAEERDVQLRAVVIEALNQQKAHNLPMVYKSSLCKSPDQFIHEYPNGQKFLIKQDQNSSEEKVIKKL